MVPSRPTFIVFSMGLETEIYHPTAYDTTVSYLKGNHN